MNHFRAVALPIFGTLVSLHPALAVEGNPGRGQRVFGACVACPSLEPNRNMTGRF